VFLSGEHVSSSWNMPLPPWKQSIFWQCPQVSSLPYCCLTDSKSIWWYPKSHNVHLVRQQLHLDKQWHWSLIMLFVLNHFPPVKLLQQDSLPVLPLLLIMLLIASVAHCKTLSISLLIVLLRQLLTSSWQYEKSGKILAQNAKHIHFNHFTFYLLLKVAARVFC